MTGSMRRTSGSRDVPKLCHAARHASLARPGSQPGHALRGDVSCRPVRRCWWVVAPRGSALIRRRGAAVTGECRVQHSTSDLKQGQSCMARGPGVRPDTLASTSDL